MLVIDEINRGDLSRVLGEAIFLFESGDGDRTIELPHEYEAAGSCGSRADYECSRRSTPPIARLHASTSRYAGGSRFFEMWPDLDSSQREQRVRRRIEHELLPLLSAYVDERLRGPATGEVQGLVDRIAGRLRSMADQHAKT